jgi:alpha-beta hydrolase superfamily lysophospholipase
MTVAERAAARVQVRTPLVARTPLFMGAGDRTLFGWYHAPADRAPSAAVVICPPLGHEYINAHRSLRHLADRCAEAGMAALRFDYDGTGDSAGDHGTAGRLAAWVDSIHRAIDELCAASRSQRITIVGLRMGALLGSLAACDDPVAGLVLWAPCTRGRSFIRELRALASTNLQTQAGTRAFEAAGFHVSEAL